MCEAFLVVAAGHIKMIRHWILIWGSALWVAVSGCAGPKAGRPASTEPFVAQTRLTPPRDPLAKLERSLLFYPTPYDPRGNWSPEGLLVEDVQFESSDGTRLDGWYVHHPRPRAVVLYCHGNAGNITHRVDILRKLHELGVAVMIFDYRGYGKSEGTPSEAGVLADARAARKWLARRTGLDEHEIVLMGRSLGGAVAVDLAVADGARGLVLQSTFSSVPDVAAELYPLLPVRPLMRTRFDSASKIGRYHGPLLQSHGDADRVVPYELGHRLHDAANEPKQFFTIRGGDHNDPQPAGYYEALVAFLDQLE